jgi:transcriptional regulator with XRE-family HTH domain
MERRPEFGRRFRALTADETQEQVAERLGISQPSVSRMARDLPPTPRVLERLVREYGLDGAEWQALAGYGEETEEERTARIAGRAAEEALRRAGLLSAAVPPPPPLSGADRLVQGLRELNRKHGRPVPVDLSGGTEGNDGLTVARAEALLQDLERQLEEGLI